jgi:hypothetical protein
MLLEAGAQILEAGLARRFARGHADIDRRQRVLIQTKGLSGEALDAVAGDGGAEGARCDAQAQSRIRFMIGQHRQAKERIGKFFAALPNYAKFGRLMQTLARLERQFTDR